MTQVFRTFSITINKEFPGYHVKLDSSSTGLGGQEELSDLSSSCSSSAHRQQTKHAATHSVGAYS